MRSLPIYGGVIIDPTEGVALKDMFSGVDLSQDLVDQTPYTDAATLFIPIHPTIVGSEIEITAVVVGYVDGSVNVDDLADLVLFSGTDIADQRQQEKFIWASGAIAETPVSGPPDKTTMTLPIRVHLDDESKLYFVTNWTTAVIDCGAGEFFYIKFYGNTFIY